MVRVVRAGGTKERRVRFGNIKLFCPNCGAAVNTSDRTLYHMKEFGYVHRACHEALELKYARMILGKDSE